MSEVFGAFKLWITQTFANGKNCVIVGELMDYCHLVDEGDDWCRLVLINVQAAINREIAFYNTPDGLRMTRWLEGSDFYTEPKTFEWADPKFFDKVQHEIERPLVKGEWLAY